MSNDARSLGLFKNRVSPGVYFLDTKLEVHVLFRSAQQYDFQLFHVDGKDVSNSESFLEKFGSTMHFPDYYGQNWNAFEECIRDFEWHPAKGYIIWYKHFEVFFLNDSQQFYIALDIFRSAIQFWRDRNIPMFLFLEGEKDIAERLKLHKLGQSL